MSANERWAKAFVDLAAQIREMQERIAALRDEVRNLKPGTYTWGTVYTVRDTRVRAHDRRGFTAVRIRRRA